MPYTIEQFAESLRATNPPGKFTGWGDSALVSTYLQHNPQYLDYLSKEEQEQLFPPKWKLPAYRPGFIKQLGFTFKQHLLGIPSTIPGMIGSVLKSKDIVEYSENAREWGNKLIEKKIEEDPQLQALVIWNEEEPYSFKNFMRPDIAVRGVAAALPSIIEMALITYATHGIGLFMRAPKYLTTAGKLLKLKRLKMAARVGRIGGITMLETSGIYGTTMQYFSDRAKEKAIAAEGTDVNWRNYFDMMQAANTATISGGIYGPLAGVLENFAFENIIRAAGLGKLGERVLGRSLTKRVADGLVFGTLAKGGAGYLRAAATESTQEYLQYMAEAVTRSAYEEGYGDTPTEASKNFMATLGAMLKNAPEVIGKEHWSTEARASFFSGIYMGGIGGISALSGAYGQHAKNIALKIYNNERALQKRVDKGEMTDEVAATAAATYKATVVAGATAGMAAEEQESWQSKVDGFLEDKEKTAAVEDVETEQAAETERAEAEARAAVETPLEAEPDDTYYRDPEESRPEEYFPTGEESRKIVEEPSVTEKMDTELEKKFTEVLKAVKGQKGVDKFSKKSDIGGESDNVSDKFQRVGVSALPLITEVPKLAMEAETRIRKHYPWIKIGKVEGLIKEHGTAAVGKAFRDVAVWSVTDGRLDTVPHEPTHLIISAMRDTGIVKLGIKNFGGSEEALIQYTSEYYVGRITDKNLLNRLRIWIKNFWLKAKQLFGTITPEEATALLAEKIYRGIPLVELGDRTVPVVKYQAAVSANEVSVKKETAEKNEGDLEPEGVIDTGQRTYFSRVWNVYIPPGDHAEMVNNALEADVSDADVFVAGMTQWAKDKYGAISEKAEAAEYTPRDINQLKDFFQKHKAQIERVHEDPTTGEIVGDRVYYYAVFDTDGRLEKLRVDLEGIDRSTNRNWPRFVAKDFTEDEGLVKTYRLPYKNITKHVVTDDYDFSVRYAGGVSGQTVQLLERIFADNYEKGREKVLLFFAGTKGGGNSQMLLSKVPDTILKTIKSREDYIGYLKKEVDAGNITGDTAKEFVFSADRWVKKNPYVYAQKAARHEWAKAVTHVRYAHTDYWKSIEDFFNRLKIAFAEGFTPIGLDKALDKFKATNRVMIIPKETEVEHNGKRVPYSDGDGAMYTSSRWFDALSSIIGRDVTTGSKLSVVKLAMRYRSKNGKDYAAFKMSNQTPFEDMKFYKPGETKPFAEVRIDEKGMRPDRTFFYDLKGKKEFDHIASDNEVKQRVGKFEKYYKVFDFNENNFKALITPGEFSRTDAAFPVTGLELPMDKTSDSPALANLLEETKKHYEEVAEDWFAPLFGFRDNPEQIVELLKRPLAEGEVPTELQYYLSLDPTGKMLMNPSVLNQVIPFLNNYFIRDNAYKVRQIGAKATMAYFKPQVGLDVGRNEVMFSAENLTLLDNVREVSGKKKPADLNQWLKANEFYILASRQPTSKSTGYRLLRLTELVEGKHGDTVFLNRDDVAEVFEGDWDFDSGMFEVMSKEWEAAMLEWQNSKEYQSRHRPSEILDIFANRTDRVGGSHIANDESFYRTITNQAMLENATGIIVNLTNTATNFAYKDMTISIEDKVYKFKNPRDTVVLDYMPIRMKDPGIKASVERLWDKLAEYGTKIVRKDGEIVKTLEDALATEENLFLKTTFEHEMGILLKASTDDPKYGLLGRINFNRDSMIRRMVGQEIPESHFPLIRTVIDYFNNGRRRQAAGLSLEANISQSAKLHDLFYGEFKDNAEFLDYFNRILLEHHISRTERNWGKGRTYRNAVRQVQDITTKMFNFNVQFDRDKISPMEYLLTRLGKRFEGYKDNWFNGANPMQYSDNVYNVSHYRAVAKLHDYSMLRLAEYTEERRKEVLNKAVRFSNKVANSFYEIIPEDAEERINVDYNTEMQNLIAEYRGEYLTLSKEEQILHTIHFLYGTMKPDGSYRRNIKKWLPYELMDGDTTLHFSGLRAAEIETIKEIKAPVKAKGPQEITALYTGKELFDKFMQIDVAVKEEVAKLKVERVC